MHKMNGRSEEAERGLSETQPTDNECNDDYKSMTKAVAST